MACFDPCPTWKWVTMDTLLLSSMSLPGHELASISAFFFAGCCCSESTSGGCNAQVLRPGFSCSPICAHSLSDPPIISWLSVAPSTTHDWADLPTSHFIHKFSWFLSVISSQRCDRCLQIISLTLMSISEHKSASHSAFLMWTNSSSHPSSYSSKSLEVKSDSSQPSHQQILLILLFKGTRNIASLYCLHYHPGPPHAPSDATLSLKTTLTTPLKMASLPIRS